ncbi:hypothetical protein BC830DRAFT_845525 [Chytriomyces sp. MP71]|nr:hypothetical protein BC830DRAFT_845525 [Chytriomyces sp. MP71]
MSPTATAAAATNPSAATRLRVYTFNAATNVFANASGATSSGCDASESLSIGRIRSYSTPPRVSFSSPDAAAASTQRQPIPATAFTAQRLAEVLAARPQALLNTLLLDVSSPHNPNMPSPAIPYARRIPALLRLCHTLASVSDVSTSPLIASSSSSSSSPQGPPSPLACYPTGRKTLPISMSSPQPVGNDFARVETQDVQSMDTSDSDSCSSQTVNHDHFDYVKFFRDVVEGGMLQFHFSGLDLDFANSSECQADSHFNRRFLQPMVRPKSTIFLNCFLFVLLIKHSVLSLALHQLRSSSLMTLEVRLDSRQVSPTTSHLSQRVQTSPKM